MNYRNYSVHLTPFQQNLLLKILRESHLSEIHRRRVEIMLLADIGKSQIEISRCLKCARETVRHWTNVATTGQAHYWELSPVGRPKTINDQYLKRLKELINFAPKTLGYSFEYWTASRLSKHLVKEFAIEISARHINRLLKQMGLSTRGKNLQVENQENKVNNLVINNISNVEDFEASSSGFKLLKNKNIEG
ncbi:MAG: helix-turn-helix domain-containing protein [Nostoc sp. S4]|nr:helix-turn-helix domain-containing protein [Nostoc sp. S4]